MIRDSTLTYIPFPETNAIWIDSTDINSFGKCQEFETKRKKDTLINGVNYQKLVQFHQERFQCSNIITHSNQKTVGFYRNDIANRKVWLRLPNANSDTLLYDFNLQVGDTMPESYLNDLNFGQVKIIDSIRYRLISDRWRRVFYYNGICNGANDVQFLIEGIGKTDGAFKAIEPCFLGAEYTVLGCHSINSTRVFPDSGSICKLVTGIEKQNKEKNLLVFPNPTNGQIFLTLSSDIESLKLYDITGRLILEKGGHEKQLMLPEDKGMYLLHIQLNNGNSILKKLIRN